MRDTRIYKNLLQEIWDEQRFVCVGLDPDIGKIPDAITRNRTDVYDILMTFLKLIVDATYDYAAAYKANSAFFEKFGVDGIKALIEIVRYIQNGPAMDLPVILDAKRADIGNTNIGYASFAFDIVRADAITVHPYLGAEALKPFLNSNKGVFVLCRTSNPGAGEFQDLLVDGEPLYQVVARRVAKEWSWNGTGNCGVVVGATYPDELRSVRKIVGETPILIPGIGAQGGDLEATIDAGLNVRGDGILINSSRGIIHASSGNDFAEAARREAEKLHNAINARRHKLFKVRGREVSLDDPKLAERLGR